MKCILALLLFSAGILASPLFIVQTAHASSILTESVFNLDPAIIPEPKAMFLMGLGLLSLVAFHYISKPRKPQD